MDTAPVILAHEKPFRIGKAVFRPASREVQLNGSHSIVEPRVMQLLVALHRASGGVVTKDELLQQCWSGRIIGEDAINRVVSRLRSVSEKQAGSQFRIETITKVGYRLVTAKEFSTSTRLRDASRLLKSFGRREVMMGGAALGVATVASVSWTAPRRGIMSNEARLLVDDARNSLYQFTPDQIENSIGKLRRATQLSPDSAEAWGLLALAYANSTFYTPTNRRANRLARSEGSRQRAFSIEPFQADALAAELGTRRVFGNWYSQEKRCRAALHRHPDHPVLHVALGHLLLEVGRFDESLPMFEESLRKTPLCVTSLLSRINLLADLGRLEEADAAVSHAFGIMPRQPAIWLNKVHYLSYSGDAVEAAAMIADVSRRPMGIPAWHFDLLAMQANAIVRKDESLIRKTIQRYDEAARRGMGLVESATIFAAFTGWHEESFRILNGSYLDPDFMMPEVHSTSEQGMYSLGGHRTDILFRKPLAVIRRDPRFARLTREIGLDEYWARTKSRSKVVA